MDAPTYKIALSKYQLSQKIPYGSDIWPRFNASFNNREIDPPRLMQMIYDGHALTTWHKDHWRVGANYICGQHLGLDFDAGDNTSSIPTLMKDKFIQRYASILYTTMSHTPEAPRARVMFLLDQPIMQAKNYTLAASALLWLFGTADRQCKDAVRFFYGSPGCEFEYLDNVLPLEIVKKLICDYQASGAGVKKRTERNYHAPADQEDVQKALRFIPPWGIEYDQWVQVLMGIHSEFGDAGYMLAEAWADGKPGEVEQKWKSFKQNGNTAGAVTIGTVFGIAKEYGWKHG